MGDKYNFLAAGCALLATASGAWVTNGNHDFTGAHRVAGILLTIALLPLLRSGVTGWFALALAAVEFIPVNSTELPAAIVHACVAPAVLATALAAGLPSRPEAQSGVSAGLRKLILSTPPLVLLQIALGAAYRHKALGVLPHMAGAMLVSGLILVVCVILLQGAPPDALRLRAVWLMSLVLAQISLGIAAFTLRLLDADSSVWFGVIALCHVLTGSMVLAASTVLAVEFVQRRVAVGAGFSRGGS